MAGQTQNDFEQCTQHDVLREMVDRIVVDRAGNIVRMDLRSPFAYLKRLTDRAKREADAEGTERNKNSDQNVAAPECSDCTASSGPEEIRTLDLYSAIVALSQLSYRPVELTKLYRLVISVVKIKFKSSRII